MKYRNIKEKKYKKLSLEVLLKIFYAYDITSRDLGELKGEFLKTVYLPTQYINQIDEIINLYKNNSDYIDNLISSHLSDWRFERLGKIEKAILRIGVSYIYFLKQTLTSDAYNREIRYIISFLLEILECYGGIKKSVKFVNGILGKISRQQEIHIISA